MTRGTRAITHRVAARRLSTIGLALALALAAGTCGAAQAAPPATHATRFVVQTAGAVPARAALQASARSLDITQVTALGRRLAAVTVRSRSGSTAAIARSLTASRLIDSATADRRVTAFGTRAPVRTSDTWFSSQWDLWDAAATTRAGGYGVDAPRAWTRTTGSSDVVVAVLDTGITDHPDLAGAHLAPGYDFVSEEDGVNTGDGDGWDADPTDEGDACADLGESSSWHGTFVTGEIAAKHGGQGVAGEASGVTIEPVRVLGGCGGSEADTIAAVEWASGGTVAGVPANARPARVISMSLGSASGTCSDGMQTAVDDAIGRGSIVVSAAGNDGSALSATSPANCAGVVSVAATTRTGALAGYSNHGTAALSPTIAAPGGTDANPILGDGWTSKTTFAAAGNRAAVIWDEGTSMATPRVSASIALLLSLHPELTRDQVVARLIASATPFPAAANCTPTRCGPGIVNAGNLVGAAGLFVHATAVRVTGTTRVGHRLAARAAVWHPTPTRTTFRWLRDGRPIAGATHRTFVVREKDAGHRIAVRVTVGKASTVTASTTSAARRITR